MRLSAIDCSILLLLQKSSQDSFCLEKLLNALVKMLIYFSGACAAGVVVGGKVPVVITSRSDEAQARLASIAAAVVALD